MWGCPLVWKDRPSSGSGPAATIKSVAGWYTWNVTNLVVQWKGRIPAGKTCAQPVISLDILPTALAAAGVDVQPDWKLDGANLLPFLTGEKQGSPHDTLYWRFRFPPNQPALYRWAIRQGDWKLVKNDREPVALYHLATDIGETNNLAAEQPDRVAALQAAWQRWDAPNREPLWTEPRVSVNPAHHAKVQTFAAEIRMECTGNDPQIIFGDIPVPGGQLHVIGPRERQRRVVDRRGRNVSGRIAGRQRHRHHRARGGVGLKRTNQLRRRGLRAAVRIQFHGNRPRIRHRNDRVPRAAQVPLRKRNLNAVAVLPGRHRRESDFQVLAGVETGRHRRGGRSRRMTAEAATGEARSRRPVSPARLRKTTGTAARTERGAPWAGFRNRNAGSRRDRSPCGRRRRRLPRPGRRGSTG